MLADVQLDEIQQVYFGLKTDDVTYVSQSMGGDDKDGLSINTPKKTITNFSTKYIMVLDGIFDYGTGSIPLNATNENPKIILGKINTVTFICYKSNNINFYNCTFNVSGRSIAIYNNNFYNCIVSILTSTNLGDIINNNKCYNCFINIFKGFVSNPINISSNCTINQANSQNMISSKNYCIETIDNNIISNPYKEDDISELLKNLGDPSILNPDGTRSDIGITGGPYYFNGFKKNLSSNDTNVTIDTINNKIILDINNVNINPNIVNISNGIKQKLYKTDLTLLSEKLIDVETGQIKTQNISI